MWSSFLLRASIVAGIAALVSTAAKPEESSDSSASAALSYQSTEGGGDCMTLAAARGAHPRSHLYWHGAHHCWDAIPPGAHGARARSAKPEHVVRPSKPEHAVEFAAATPFVDQGRLETTQPIAMLTDYLAFDMVLEEWRQMSRGLVTPLVDEASSEFDQRFSQR